MHLNKEELKQTSWIITPPNLKILLFSNTDSSIANSEGLLEGVVWVSSNEVLKQELAVSEVRGVILEWLSVASHESLLEISGEPNPFFHVFSTEEVLSLLDELISAHLDVLVEKVAAEDLLAIAVVKNVGSSEKETQCALGHELHILVMEEDVVVVEEQELSIISINLNNIDLQQR